MKSPFERGEGARPAVPPDAESCPTHGPADHASDTPSALDDFSNWLRNPRPDASGAAAFALFLLIIFVGLIFAVWSAGPLSSEQSAADLSLGVPPSSEDLSGDLSRADPPSDGQSVLDLSAHQKRLASNAAYRARRSADPTFRESESQTRSRMAAHKPR